MRKENPMTPLAEWISPAVLRTLALALLHFLWQGAALAALAYLALALCRSASKRYVISVVALMAMLASPVATFLAVRAPEAAVEPSDSVADIPSAVNRLSVAPAKAAVHLPGPQEVAPVYLLLFVEAWFAGVVLLSLRSLGGIFLIERLRRRESTCVADRVLELCVELQDRMGISRVIRYCQSMHLDVPVVAGWLRPVVVLPISAITGLSQAQLGAVIAHELAHIRRYDAFVNLFQVAVETLLFYHPAVWWLGKRIRTEREHCCDDAAVAVCGSPVLYARALALLAETKPAPQLAMALDGGPLVERVARLLGSSRGMNSLRTANLSAGVFCLSVALLGGTALVGGAHRLRAQTTPTAPSAAAAVMAPSRPTPPTAPAFQDDAIIVVPPRDSAPEPPTPAPAGRSARALAPDPKAAPAPRAFPQSDPQQPKQSYIDSLKDAGLSNLTVDELVSLKTQGVNAEYVKSMKELGMKADPDELIGMKIQGVTPSYVKEMRAATGQNLDADAVIGLKIQGVSPDYVRQMHDLGLQVDADDLVGMKIQGISPEYVKEMRGLGLKVDSDNLVAMKIQGVTGDYVKNIHELGLHPDTDQLIGMKIQGVTAAYLKELQAAGFKVDPDEAIAAKIQGITPEFIASVRSHGFKDLTLEKLIALKHSGVLDAEK
jgi:beta-lactamase regulating signal transducer with metallopeptidase domain